MSIFGQSNQSDNQSAQFNQSGSSGQSSQSGQASFGDKEIFTDMLDSQKMITGNYNNSANEAACDSVKTEFMNILADEHKMQHELFLEMQKRGWYKPEQAEQTKITQARQKFVSPGQNQ
jgi:spore coat protein CotF